MKPHFRFALSLLLFGSTLSSALQAAEMTVSGSDGITLLQLDFPDDDVPLMNSAVGMLEADLIRLRTQTGMNTGYLNMVLGNYWAIRNMPVMSDADYPYSHLSSKFDLGVSTGTDVTSLDVVLSFSDTVLQSAPTGSPASIPVEAAASSQGGMSDVEFPTEGSRSPTSPPNNVGVSFSDPSNNRMIFQLDHPNIEAAHNQCFPASVANSLAFLEKTTALKLPHRNVPGLKGDQSLVGQLDTTMNRPVTSRLSGRGTNVDEGISGKLQYLADNDLHMRISTRHWGRFGNQNFLASNGDKVAVSMGQGSSLDFNKLVDALDGGEDCEIGYYYTRADGSTGGHAVDLVAAGYIAGQPFMIENSDLRQGDDNAGAGRSGFIFSHLTPRSDGYLGKGGTEFVARAMCQKYIPEPVPTGSQLPPPQVSFFIPGTNTDLLKVTDPAGHSCCAEFPPSALDLLFENGIVILKAITGANVPWLPMSLNLDDAGALSGNNTATVAGFGGIHNTITGQVGQDKITAQITLGKNGGLPQGEPIISDLNITPNEPWPWTLKDPEPELRPAVRVNGFRETHRLNAGEPVSISVSLQPGTSTETAEWWLVVEAGDGVYYSFDAASETWVPGINPVIISPAMALNPTNLYTFKDGLPSGSYRIHFGLDNHVNGIPDLDALTVDSIQITVD